MYNKHIIKDLDDWDDIFNYEELLEADEITPAEEAFLQGYYASANAS